MGAWGYDVWESDSALDIADECSREVVETLESVVKRGYDIENMITCWHI